MRESKRLLAIFRSLPPARREALVEYAEYLAERTARDTPEPVPIEPLPIPRPAEESVVKAIQRLMQTYPMLDRNQLFHDASAQMTRHLLHGVPAPEAIDALEALFSRHYADWRAGREAAAPDPAGQPGDCAARSGGGVQF